MTPRNQEGETADGIHSLQGEVDSAGKRAPVAFGGGHSAQGNKGLGPPPRSFQWQFECGAGKAAMLGIAEAAVRLQRSKSREGSCGKTWRPERETPV
jgi:hypothetical protein